MNKDTHCFGIDISKDFFDVMSQQGVHYQFKNTEKGFINFLKILSKKSHCVMESTGYYHYQLAYFLVEKNILVSVENPLSVKRFIQMKLSKIKTDKSDAKMICEYAQNVTLKLWEGESKEQQECLQIIRILSVYRKQSTALKNKIHGEHTLGNTKTLVVKSIKRSLKSIKKETDLLEKKLLEIVKELRQDLLTRLESIPGLGRKTSLMLIVLTNGFNRFETASALCCYSGLRNGYDCWHTFLFRFI
jgi:transposase